MCVPSAMHRAALGVRRSSIVEMVVDARFDGVHQIVGKGIRHGVENHGRSHDAERHILPTYAGIRALHVEHGLWRDDGQAIEAQALESPRRA